MTVSRHPLFPKIDHRAGRGRPSSPRASESGRGPHDVVIEGEEFVPAPAAPVATGEGAMAPLNLGLSPDFDFRLLPLDVEVFVREYPDLDGSGTIKVHFLATLRRRGGIDDNPPSGEEVECLPPFLREKGLLKQVIPSFLGRINTPCLIRLGPGRSLNFPGNTARPEGLGPRVVGRTRFPQSAVGVIKTNDLHGFLLYRYKAPVRVSGFLHPKYKAELFPFPFF